MFYDFEKYNQYIEKFGLSTSTILDFLSQMGHDQKEFDTIGSKHENGLNYSSINCAKLDNDYEVEYQPFEIKWTAGGENITKEQKKEEYKKFYKLMIKEYGNEYVLDCFRILNSELLHLVKDYGLDVVNLNEKLSAKYDDLMLKLECLDKADQIVEKEKYSQARSPKAEENTEAF